MFNVLACVIIALICVLLKNYNPFCSGKVIKGDWLYDHTNQNYTHLKDGTVVGLTGEDHLGIWNYHYPYWAPGVFKLSNRESKKDHLRALLFVPGLLDDIYEEQVRLKMVGVCSVLNFKADQNGDLIFIDTWPTANKDWDSDKKLWIPGKDSWKKEDKEIKAKAMKRFDAYCASNKEFQEQLEKPNPIHNGTCWTWNNHRLYVDTYEEAVAIIKSGRGVRKDI